MDHIICLIFVLALTFCVHGQDKRYALMETKKLEISCEIDGKNLTEGVTWEFEQFGGATSKSRLEPGPLPEQYVKNGKVEIAIDTVDRKANYGPYMGYYTCKHGDKFTQYIAKGKPEITKLSLADTGTNGWMDHKSIGVYVGDTLRVDCQAKSFKEYGEDKESVNFYRLDSVPTSMETSDYYKQDEDRTFTGDKYKLEGNGSSATLTITGVTHKDRIFLICFIDNGAATSTRYFQIRVKEQIAALWPFLGIVGEVLILCTIIFIYEKRRVKPEFDDVDSDQQAEGKGQVASKSQEVRQRK